MTKRTDEDRAVLAIRKAGGTVVVDEGLPGKPVVKVSFRSESALRQAAANHHRFLNMLTDYDLEELKPHLLALPHLKHLDLGKTSFISGKGLEHLKSLRNLEKLVIGSESDRLTLRQSDVDDLKSALPNTTIIVKGELWLPNIQLFPVRN